MKISTSKWFFIFIYLMVSLPVGVSIAVVATQVLIKLIFFFLYGVSIDLSSIDFAKILKGSIGGGIIGAIGCWWIYYQRYRQKR
ncbi:hypothetical protein [Erwinia piriflorinigrans]|uniref:hypothetical protein n=1 Tax=Erwinia piriflorinigrans TaxID=665097 RepID=UPI000661147B|nr:hypothetical protein [Erwinia piriflorinigrans]